MPKKHICPACGKKAMVRRPMTNGKYQLVCSVCGATRGKFKSDRKKGIV